MILEQLVTEDDESKLSDKGGKSAAYTLKIRGGGGHLHKIGRQERNSGERSVDTD